MSEGRRLIMLFDTSTTLIAVSCIVAVLGVQSLFFWARERHDAPWLGWFGGAFLCGAVSVEVGVFPSNGNDFLLVGVGTGLRILCFAFLWHATRVFTGRRPEHLVAV